VYDITELNEIPQPGNGFAKYLSCLPEDANVQTTALAYRTHSEYQKALDLTNARLTELGSS